MPFYVSRQSYWPDGEPIVEIAAGGRDYANPDMLTSKFAAEGEGREFADPREAVEAAIRVCNAWRALRKGKGAKKPRVAFGSTMPFEADTYEGARSWAARVWDKLPKCDGCPKPLDGNKWRANDWDGLTYCSERCAERAVEFEAEQEARWDAEMAAA